MVQLFIAQVPAQKYVIQYINTLISRFFTHFSIFFRIFVVC